MSDTKDDNHGDMNSSGVFERMGYGEIVSSLQDRIRVLEEAAEPFARAIERVDAEEQSWSAESYEREIQSRTTTDDFRVISNVMKARDNKQAVLARYYDLLIEAADSVHASLAETEISDARKQYRIDLEARLRGEAERIRVNLV